MEMKMFIKRNKGISLVTLVITIVIIIILAAISMYAFFSQEKANFARFVQEFEEVRKGVETKRLINAENNIEYIDEGFSKVYVTGSIPYNFISLESQDGKDSAYLVDLHDIGYDELRTGRDYPNFKQEGENIKTVTFGKDDVYVYDSTGRLFYAKGFLNEDKVYYESLDNKTINIVDVKVNNVSNTTARISITIESEKEVKSVTVNGSPAKEITKGKTYEFDVNKNGTFEIIAENVEGEKDTENVYVSGLKSSSSLSVKAVVTNGTLESGRYVIKEKTAKIEITSDGAKELYVGNSSSDVPGTYLPFAKNIEKYYTTDGEKEVYIYVKDDFGNVSDCNLRILVSTDDSVTPGVQPPESIDFGEIQHTITSSTPTADGWSRTKYLKIEYPAGKQSNGYTSMYRISIDKAGTVWGRWTISYDRVITLELTKECKVEAKIVYESNYNKKESAVAGPIVIDKIDRTVPIVTMLESEDTGTKTIVRVDGRDNESGLNATPYMLSLDNIDFSNVDKVGNYTWTSQKEIDVNKDGKYYLYVRDKVNNVAVSNINVDVVDRTPPVITSVIATATLDYVSIKATIQDETGVVAYALTNTEAEPTEWISVNEQELITTENTVTEDGDYYVWAKDAAGNKAHRQIAAKTSKFPELDNTKPSNVYIKEGETATFSIVITKAGEPPTYEYEWQLSNDAGSTWHKIEGANAATYSFEAQLKDNNNQYRCLIKHARGVLTSKVATLNVVQITTDRPSGVVSAEKDMFLGGIIINDGETETTSTKLSLEIVALNAYEMNISESSTFSNDNWQGYLESIDYELKNKDAGKKTIYVKIRDAKGNESTKVVSAEITLRK